MSCSSTNCYLCFNIRGKLKTLHSPGDDNIPLVQKFYYCIYKEEWFNTDLSISICIQCNNALDIAYAFKKMCIENSDRLKIRIQEEAGELNPASTSDQPFQIRINKDIQNEEFASIPNAIQVKQELIDAPDSVNKSRSSESNENATDLANNTESISKPDEPSTSESAIIKLIDEELKNIRNVEKEKAPAIKEKPRKLDNEKKSLNKRGQKIKLVRSSGEETKTIDVLSNKSKKKKKSALGKKSLSTCVETVEIISLDDDDESNGADKKRKRLASAAEEDTCEQMQDVNSMIDGSKKAKDAVVNKRKKKRKLGSETECESEREVKKLHKKAKDTNDSVIIVAQKGPEFKEKSSNTCEQVTEVKSLAEKTKNVNDLTVKKRKKKTPGVEEKSLNKCEPIKEVRFLHEESNPVHEKEKGPEFKAKSSNICEQVKEVKSLEKKTKKVNDLTVKKNKKKTPEKSLNKCEATKKVRTLDNISKDSNVNEDRKNTESQEKSLNKCESVKEIRLNNESKNSNEKEKKSVFEKKSSNADEQVNDSKDITDSTVDIRKKNQISEVEEKSSNTREPIRITSKKTNDSALNKCRTEKGSQFKKVVDNETKKIKLDRVCEESENRYNSRSVKIQDKNEKRPVFEESNRTEHMDKSKNKQNVQPTNFINPSILKPPNKNKLEEPVTSVHQINIIKPSITTTFHPTNIISQTVPVNQNRFEQSVIRYPQTNFMDSSIREPINQDRFNESFARHPQTNAIIPSFLEPMNQNRFEDSVNRYPQTNVMNSLVTEPMNQNRFGESFTRYPQTNVMKSSIREPINQDRFGESFARHPQTNVIIPSLFESVNQNRFKESANGYPQTNATVPSLLESVARNQIGEQRSRQTAEIRPLIMDPLNKYRTSEIIPVFEGPANQNQPENWHPLVSSSSSSKSKVDSSLKYRYCVECGILMQRENHEQIFCFSCAQKTEGDIKCTHCAQTFKDKNNLVLHKYSVHQERKCQICGLILYTKKDFSAHKLDYHGYRCKLCRKKFHSKSLFKKHTRKHNSEHPCSLCGLKFFNLDLLNCHKKIYHKNKMRMTKKKSRV